MDFLIGVICGLIIGVVATLIMSPNQSELQYYKRLAEKWWKKYRRLDRWYKRVTEDQPWLKFRKKSSDNAGNAEF